VIKNEFEIRKRANRRYKVDSPQKFSKETQRKRHSIRRCCVYGRTEIFEGPKVGY